MSSTYPSDWDSRRKNVYARDDYTCAHCGIGGGPNGNAELHAHHIVPKSRGGSDKLSNLITLCNQCHNAVHSKNGAPRSPSGHGFNIGQDRTGIDWGTLGDAIIQDIVNTFDSLQVSGPHLDNSQVAEEYAERYGDIRLSVLQITDAMEQLDTLSTKQYPDEVVQAHDEAMAVGIEILQELLEYYGQIYEHIEEVIDSEMTCSDCGANITSDLNFCTECGESVEQYPDCPGCGIELQGEFDFCGNCGESLDEVEITDAAQKVTEASEIIEEMGEYIEDNTERIIQAMTERTNAIEKHSQF